MNKLTKLLCIFIFILSAFFLIINNTPEIKAEEVYPFRGMVNTYAVVIHNAPNTSSSSYDTELIYGTRVTVNELVTGKNTSGSNTKMYKITYDNGKVGYISAS